MTAIQEIEKAVSTLPTNELAKFRAWFEEFEAKNWDKQFEKDALSGKLDKIADKAITDYKNGKFRDL